MPFCEGVTILYVSNSHNTACVVQKFLNFRIGVANGYTIRIGFDNRGYRLRWELECKGFVVNRQIEYTNAKGKRVILTVCNQPREFPNGEAARQFIRNHKQFLDATIVSTPTGGSHEVQSNCLVRHGEVPGAEIPCGPTPDQDERTHL